MALTTIFGTLTTATGGELDTNFSEVGVLTTIPCLLAGTNAITLTAELNTPTISSYTNYLRLSGIIAVTNTGPVTVQLLALAALPLYKDTASGPIALTGSELQAGNAAVFVYDSALNSGSGGFHVQTPSSGGGSGTVTSVATNNGLTGGPITGSGTVGLAAVASLRLLANITGGSAVPIPNTMTAILDAIFGTAQGTILARGASAWASVSPGTAAQPLVTTSTGVAWGLIVSAITTAAGSNQGTAALIGLCNIAVLTSVGSGTGIILPATSGLNGIIVLNRGGNNLSVYPNSGAQIEGLGVNAADTVVASTGNACYVAVAATGSAATQWYRSVAS